MEITRPEDAELPLRERKKLQAMRRIQIEALDLVEQRGYEEVTVEDIAAAADVSPSSVYRYFGTKENVIIWDEYDPPLLAGLADHLGSLPPLEAGRLTMRTLTSRFSSDLEHSLRRARLIFGVPELEKAGRENLATMHDAVTAILATTSGRPPGDLAVRVIAIAMVGALQASIETWVEGNGKRSLQDVMDEAFDVLANGLDL